MPLEKVRKVLKIAKEPLSLETPIGDEEGSHLGDFIEDKNAILPIDAAIQSNLRETTEAHAQHTLLARRDRSEHTGVLNSDRKSTPLCRMCLLVTGTWTLRTSTGNTRPVV